MCLFLCAGVVVEQRLVLGVFVILALFDGELLVFALFEQAGDERVSEDVCLLSDAYFGVIFLGVDAERHIAGQRPGRGRPCEEVGVLAPLHRELDEYGLLLHILVSLRDFVRGKRCPATRAVRHNLVTLVKQTLVRNLLERPPHRFDVVVVVGDVGVLHVRPVTDSVGHDLPLVLILPHRLLALFDEGFDAVFFDFLFAVDAELLLDLELNGQTVSVPTGLAQDKIALHCLVTGYDVLHDAGEDVPDVRLAVGGRRSVVKIEALPAPVFLDALFENLVFFPERQHLFFALDEVQRCVYGFVHLLPL